MDRPPGDHPRVRPGLRGGRSARLALASCLAVGVCALTTPRDGQARDSVRTVVIDAGHGGDDYGAVGVQGTLEKDVVLAFSRRLGRELQKDGLRVVYTRDKDVFVSLADRTKRANLTRADLFVSIHANSSKNPDVQGAETYFMSLEAAEGDATEVAITENKVFQRADAAPDSGSVVGSILGDLIRTEHMRVSEAVAVAIQRELAGLPGPSRGVRQDKFIVLAGVNMPSVLIELGFLSSEVDERKLRRESHLQALAEAIARAIRDLRVVDREPTPDVEARLPEGGL